MAGRPELLFPLFADITTLPGIGPKIAKSLTQIGVETPRDLLFLLPGRLTPQLERVVEAMLYLLWDLKLKVGHASRTIRECVDLEEWNRHQAASARWGQSSPRWQCP